MVAAPKIPAAFSPTILFRPESDEDKIAEKFCYSLYQDIAGTMDTERSRQTRIGISEIGNPCSRCVARKLSEDQVKDPNWRAQVGTFIHAGLDEYMADAHPLDETVPPTDAAPRYFRERRVTPWERSVLGQPFVLAGSTDLYVEGATYGIVTDYKTQGTTKILTKTSKGDIGSTYNVQMHTYGLGWEKAGHLVTLVLLAALPRDNELRASAFVLQRYDRQIAVDALARIDAMLDAYEMLETAFPGTGWDRLIDSQSTASGCMDCRRYNDRDRKEAFSWIGEK